MDYQVIERIRDITEEGGDLSIRIEWDGLPDMADWTWEPFKQVVEDGAALVEEYLMTTEKRALKQRALQFIRQA